MVILKRTFLDVNFKVIPLYFIGLITAYNFHA